MIRKLLIVILSSLVVLTMTNCFKEIDNEIIDMLLLSRNIDEYYSSLTRRGFQESQGMKTWAAWYGMIEGRKYLMETLTLPTAEIEVYEIFRFDIKEGDRHLESVILPKLIAQFGSPVATEAPDFLPDNPLPWLLWTLEDRIVYLAMDYQSDPVENGRNRSSELIFVVMR